MRWAGQCIIISSSKPRAAFAASPGTTVGITRFQLPTKSVEAAERILLRRAPGAEPGEPTPGVTEAVAAAKRYFEGEEIDFSGFTLDLDDQDAFFKQIYAAARRVGWGHTTTYGALAKELAPDRRPRAMSVKPWRRIRCR